MPRDAQGKLQRARYLDTEADKLAKRDPQAAEDLHELARRARRAAIKQMKRRPRRKQARHTETLPQY